MNYEAHIAAIEQAFSDTLNSISKGEWRQNKRLIHKSKVIRKLFQKMPQKTKANVQNLPMPWEENDLAAIDA